jgi:diadenosine tetraphosphate (Ap4A) HIT family hydrolase
MDTLIHQRVRLAHEGKNPTAIRHMSSGWLILGDNQRLRGYSLLLSDPVVGDINELSGEARADFLRDMVIIGDALLEVTGAMLINYMMLGNWDRALHAHIHPRYTNEPDQTRPQGPWAYHHDNVPFDLERDAGLMDQIGQAVDRRTAGR